MKICVLDRNGLNYYKLSVVQYLTRTIKRLVDTSSLGKQYAQIIMCGRPRALMIKLLLW
jgi:hypothetical protein